MKKKTMAMLMVAAGTCAPLVWAQPVSWGGWRAGLNLDQLGTSVESTVAGNSLDGGGKVEVGASLNGAYGFELNDAVVLALGLSYHLHDLDVFSLSGGATSASLKLKNAYSVFLEPGYRVNDRSQVYARIAYEAGTMRSEATGTSASQKDVHGAGLGIGLRTRMSKNLYLQAEARRVNYDSARFEGDTVDFRATMTVGSVGLGYAF